MLLITHLLFGLLLGMMLDSMLVVVLGAIIVDFDHIIVYIKRGIIWSPKRLWKAITLDYDNYSNPRTVAHSLFAWLIVTIAVSIVSAEYGILFSIGYLSHLVLDAVDNYETKLMFPLKAEVVGPVGYNSRAEYALMAVIFLSIIVFSFIY